MREATFPCFESLYRSLFPEREEDPCREQDYTVVRRLKCETKSDPSNVFLVRWSPARKGALCSPQRREPTDFQQVCVLRQIRVGKKDVSLQGRLLRELLLHQTIIPQKDTNGSRLVLPIYYHCLSTTGANATTAATLAPRRSKLDREEKANNPEVFLNIITPFQRLGTLSDCVKQSLDGEKKQGQLTESQVRWVILEVMRIIDGCRSRGVVISDLRAEKIYLWQEEGDLRPTLVMDLLAGHAQWPVIDEMDELRVNERDSSDRKTGVLALGKFLYTLVTGRKHGPSELDSANEEELTSSSEDRVEQRKKRRGSEKKSSVSRRCLKSHLPPDRTHAWETMLEGMLETDSKKRLSWCEIHRHPFMAADQPIETLSSVTLKGKKAKDSPPSTRKPCPRDADAGDGSDATLCSAQQQAKLSRSWEDDRQISMERRKTPFGLIRIPKDSSEEKQSEKAKDRLTHSVLWGDGYGTRGLAPVRQRVKMGKMEINKKGQVIFSIEDLKAVFSSEGAILKIVPSQLEKRISTKDIEQLYQRTAAWLRSRRRHSPLATFATTLEGLRGTELNPVGQCIVMANGPSPDFQIFYHAQDKLRISTQGTNDGKGWQSQREVNVQQRKQSVTLLTKVRSSDGAHTIFTSRQCKLLIERRRNRSSPSQQETWHLTSSPSMRMVFQELSATDLLVLEGAIAAADTVNSIFETIVGTV